MNRATFNLTNAIASFRQTHELPSVENLITILQYCRKEGNIADARCMHAILCQYGLEGRAVLGNHLVRVFVESENLMDAELVFQRLIDQNSDAWASYMHGCIDHGNAQHALELYKHLQGNLPCTTKSLLQTLLKACAKLKDAEQGEVFHFEIVKLGLETDPFLGSALVDMYAKSGAIVTAREVFNKLQDRDVVLWTAIVSGCVEHGFLDEGFECMNKMQVEGVSPNAVTLVCILKGCGSKTCADRAHQVHTDIIILGFEKDPVVNSTLVDVYSKCGLFVETENLFQNLLVRDVILWTLLIAAYAEQGCGEETLRTLDQMQQDGMSPNAVTYICSLKAFSDSKARVRVHYIHSQIVKQGFEDYPSVGGTLVFTYGKCSVLDDAQGVLDGMDCRDVFSCNSLISALTDQGLDLDALNCAEKMQMEGLSANAFTYNCTLKACGRQRLIEKGLWLHAEIVVEEFEEDPYINCTLVDMYSKCGFFSEAWAIAEELPAQNAVSWTALIAGYVENGHFREALNCLKRMQNYDIPLDAVTYVCGLKACASIGALDVGQHLHSEISMEGYEDEPSVGNTLVDMYAKCGCLKEAEDIFDELPDQQLVSWTALITGYMDLKLIEQALIVYERMPLEWLSVDAVIFASGLKACGSLVALDKGQKIHAEIAREEFEEDPTITSSLVDMYAKCGSLVEAWEVLNEQPVQNVVVWTALITGFACQGNSDAVFSMLEIVVREGIQPDAVTLLNVVTVCSHGGLVEKGLKFFKTISMAFCNAPTLELYNCFMDLFSRAGQLVESLRIVEEMPFQPNLVTWNTILGACQKSSNVELGRHAFQSAVALDSKQPAAYISMISIYADAHMWEDVKKVELLRGVARNLSHLM